MWALIKDPRAEGAHYNGFDGTGYKANPNPNPSPNPKPTPNLDSNRNPNPDPNPNPIPNSSPHLPYLRRCCMTRASR